MRKVQFSFSNGQVNGKITETVEFEDDTTDEEIDTCLSEWLWDRSNANWRELD